LNTPNSPKIVVLENKVKQLNSKQEEMKKKLATDKNQAKKKNMTAQKKLVKDVAPTIKVAKKNASRLKRIRAEKKVLQAKLAK